MIVEVTMPFNLYLILIKQDSAHQGEIMVNYIEDINNIQLNTAWWNMYNRCYSNRYHERSPQYIGCEMDEVWIDDKNAFKEWMLENKYIIPGEQIDLDKDILKKGNKIYGPDTCIYVPHRVNAFVENMAREPQYMIRMDKWKAEVSFDGAKKILGYYDTREEAIDKMVRYKKAALLDLADYYEEFVPEKVYKAIKKYKVERSDFVN